MRDREQVTADALGSVRAEGLEPSAGLLRDIHRYIHGEIDSDELLRRTRERLDES